MRSLTDQELRTWRLFLHASTRLLARLDDDLRAGHGERLTDFDVLSNLSEAPGGMLRMSDLAEQTLFSRSRLTYTVNGLEERGLVMRSPDPRDGRGVTATLTPDGRKLHRKLAATHVQGIGSYFLDRVPQDQHDSLAEALTGIVDSLEGEGINAD